MTIIFSGRRWRIIAIRDKEKLIEVTADRAGRPPPFFGGGGGLVHDRVVEKMMAVLSNADIPAYIDEIAVCLLENARSEFRRLDFLRRPICKIGERSSLIATSSGTVKTSTLALALRSMGYTAETYDGFLNVSYEEGTQPLETALKEIIRSEPVTAEILLSGKENLMTEKFHPYLSLDLLLEDTTGSRIDLGTLPQLAHELIESGN